MSNNRYEMVDEEYQEGFQRAEALTEQYTTINKSLDIALDAIHNNNLNLQPTKKKKGQFLIKEKPKIKFDVLELFSFSSRKKGDSQKYIKSMSLHKSIYEQSSDCSPLKMTQKQRANKVVQGENINNNENIMHTVIVKTKRNEIGQDLIIQVDENFQRQRLKQIQQNARLIFKKRSARSTYEYFKELSKYSQSYFLKSKYNNTLRLKLQKSQLKFQEIQSKLVDLQVKFQANIESSNLNYATKVGEEEYNLYLNVDTNTRGHQNWFYFSIINNKQEERNIKINICNIKRKFPMIKYGQGIYKRSIGKSWQFLSQVQISQLQKNKYKLTFQSKLNPLQKIEVSLIPPYTYSDLLRQIQTFQASPDVKVDILTYSLAGLAIPLLTITKGARTNISFKNRNLCLITARIHPSETCSSFIVSALVKQLISNQSYETFLKENILKIVPMVNPDGVVFGNFRTNYLGVDLNRSFHCMDEIAYPQTVAVKQLGRKCKQDFGQNFTCFLDLHGHSSQASSFIYGPEYVQGCQSYLECRILPKILDRVSTYFRYDYSNFKLEEYKFNTARGFFFKKLKIPSYTIETSYALYCSKNEKEQKIFEHLGIEQWESLGRSIIYCLKINNDCNNYTQEQKQQSKQQVVQKKRRIQSIDKIQHNISNKIVKFNKNLSKIKRQILNQIKNQKPSTKTIKHEEESDSDGDDIEQDFTQPERQIIVRRLTDSLKQKTVLPRVSKETKQSSNIPPQNIPTFYVGPHQNQLNILQRMSSKFKGKKYNRPVNISQQYTQYLVRNIAGVSSLRPQVINFNPKIYKPSRLKQSYQSLS